MAESCDVKVLEKINTEVDESQIKVILTTQCIKAQAYLVNKLRKQAERSKEICNFISNANLKLQNEIIQAQLEIKSMLIAQETIRTANVELKKEWLLTKENKKEVIERVETGEKKYEDLWMESKARYESLPFVQKLLKAKDEVQNLEKQLIKLRNDENTLTEEIKVKKETCLNLDRKRIIELAEFIVIEMPESFKIISVKSAAIRHLTDELNNIAPKANVKVEEPTMLKQKEDDLKSNNNCPSSSIMPKLQLGYLDYELFSVKLDQVKIKRVDHFNKTPEKNNINTISLIEIDARKVNRNKENFEEYISSFFNKPSQIYEENKTQNYAKKKLINILEDIKIDKKEAQKMVAEVNPDALQSINLISVDKNTDETYKVLNNDKGEKVLEYEEIEEIDLTGSNAEKLLIPPTQFLDVTLEVQVSPKEHVETLIQASTCKEVMNVPEALMSSQEGHNKKKVSFDMSSILEINEVNDTDKPEMADKTGVNETLNSQLDVSEVSNDGFDNIKDMIMKKHNLDLSPQFVYAKNIMTPLNLQKCDDKVVTSKFFQHNEKNYDADEVEKITMNDEKFMEVNTMAVNRSETENKPANQSKNDKNPISEIIADDISSPKRQKTEMRQSDKPVSGFLFSHNAQMIPDSLDVSNSTTGFEDGDADFPHCIDSNLLLSPKADLPMQTGDNSEILSQEVPNFLSGLRKTGLSFFGRLSSSESKPDSSAQNQESSGFSFNFGGEDKKSRGGLFSMFQ